MGATNLEDETVASRTEVREKAAEMLHQPRTTTWGELRSLLTYWKHWPFAKSVHNYILDELDCFPFV